MIMAEDAAAAALEGKMAALSTTRKHDIPVKEGATEGGTGADDEAATAAKKRDKKKRNKANKKKVHEAACAPVDCRKSSAVLVISVASTCGCTCREGPLNR